MNENMTYITMTREEKSRLNQALSSDFGEDRIS
ncbi:MAG: hypothetical protein ACI8TL_001458, partial [Natronomonas sp.]